MRPDGVAPPNVDSEYGSGILRFEEDECEWKGIADEPGWPLSKGYVTAPCTVDWMPVVGEADDEDVGKSGGLPAGHF